MHGLAKSETYPCEFGTPRVKRRAPHCSRLRVQALQERLVSEKKEAVAALEARIRSLEGGAGAERQDLVAQLQAAQRQLQECVS